MHVYPEEDMSRDLGLSKVGSLFTGCRVNAITDFSPSILHETFPPY